MKSGKLWHLLLILLLPLVFLTSCKEENLEPGIPAFLHIKPFAFNANYGLQGTSSQQIKDVWVFANGATIGVFELPADIPVLKEGTGELRLEAGIELNGISTTRANNPFFEPVVIDNFSFIPDSIITVAPETSYRETTEFVWLEDFEDPSVSIDTTNLQSSTDIVRVGGDEAFEGSFSGKITLDEDHKIFEAATFEGYLLPKNGQPVLLEMHYKNDYYFSVGVIEQSTSQIIKSEVLILNPSENWNKIYINLTDKVRSSSATSFKVLIRTYIEEDGTEANIWLDNFKLMYR